MSTNINAYVHPENQRLLWTTIQSVPMIANLPNDFKTKWFKDIVKSFYEKNPHIKDKESLQQMNKQTVQYMIQSAKSILSQTQNVRAAPPPTEAIGITSEFTRYETDSKKNTEWYNKAFAERQKEYEIMHAKPLAPEVNFAIQMDDAPLSNMEELIEKYKQDRENDMNPFPSPASAPASVPVTTPTLTPTNSAVVQIPLSVLDEIQQMKKDIQGLREEIEELKKRS